MYCKTMQSLRKTEIPFLNKLKSLNLINEIITIRQVEARLTKEACQQTSMKSC